MRRLFHWSGMISIAAALMIPISAVVITSVWGEEVIMISPHSEEMVRLNQLSWEEGDTIVEIYGVPTRAPIRVVFADPEKIVIPKEALHLRLLKKGPEDNPLQEQTVWYFTWILVAALTSAAALSLLILWFTRPRPESK